MSHVADELHEEFPEQAEAIHALKAKNAHFAACIAEDYHTLNRAIHRMETNVEPADDATIEDLKNSGSSSRMRSPASLNGLSRLRANEKRPGLRRGVCASSGIAPAAADCSRGCCRAWSSG